MRLSKRCVKIRGLDCKIKIEAFELKKSENEAACES